MERTTCLELYCRMRVFDELATWLPQTHERASLPRLLQYQVKQELNMPTLNERQTGEVYREHDITTILRELLLRDAKTLVVEGQNGVGKTSLLFELDEVLRKTGASYASLSMKDYCPPSSIEGVNFKFAEVISSFEKELASRNTSTLIVLLESADYIFLRIGKHYFQDLEVNRVRTEAEERVCENYKLRERLIALLQHPRVKVVVTEHTNWQSNVREPLLYGLWHQLTVKAKHHSLSPHIEPNKLKAYFLDQPDTRQLQIPEEVLATIANTVWFSEVRYLPVEELAQLVDELIQLPPNKREAALMAWREKKYPNHLKNYATSSKQQLGNAEGQGAVGSNDIWRRLRQLFSIQKFSRQQQVT